MLKFNLIEKLKIVFSLNIGGKKNNIEKSAKSIDPFGRSLMEKFGRNPEGKRHFNIKGMSLEQQKSIDRLIDLDILKFESEPKESGFEYAYHWTKFGDKVMQYLKIL